MALGPHSPPPPQHAISSSGAAGGQISRGQGDMRHPRQINPCPGTPAQASVFGLWYPPMTLRQRHGQKRQDVLRVRNEGRALAA